MRNRLFSLAVLLAVPAATAACCCGPFGNDPYEADRRELRRARDAWERAGIESYRYELARSCFCGGEAMGPVTIEVRDGAPVAVVYTETGQPAEARFFDRFDTVEELYDYVERAIQDEAHDLEAEYDDERGYPTRINNEGSANIADDEVVYTISNFEVIEDA
ncbi:MAG TPA: DUF6174 domain-containing protein [Longimicrobium sp.]|nr:DUF6174 domain-containing protein [Longimicrobium sp.]